MSDTYDVLIIGSGIMGTSIAFELSKKGYRTLTLDKLPEAGLGSTSNTCAIIRTTYSTVPGTAIAYDSYFSWKNWQAYLGTEDERGTARFIECGTVVLKPEGFDWQRYLDIHDQLSIPYEIWDRKTLLERMPHFTDGSFYPPKRYDDPSFADPPKGKIDNTVLFSRRQGILTMPCFPSTTCSGPLKSTGRNFGSAEK